jgi:hypothetical protein
LEIEIMKKVLFVLLMCVCMVTPARADLVITNGTFDGGNAGDLDVPDWYDLDNPDRGSAWWQTASICGAPNPFPDDACMMGDAYPSGDADSYIYQAMGTKASCQSYSISIDYAQPTDGSTDRSPWIKVDIYQGSFPGAADDVDIADQGLTLIDSVSSDSFPDLDIHNFTSPLDLSSANTTDMLWIRIANLPGQGTDAGSWAVVDNVQITSESAPCGSAFNPNPVDEDTDVLHDVVLSWIPGQYADTHVIYIGTVFNDVNDATIDNPLSTIALEDLDVNSYAPVILEYDTTYYWRVDEVNAPTNPGTYKGPVWSFTVEPYAIKIPAENITATASSQIEGQGPEKTIDGSGLTGDLHSSELSSMWFSQPSEPGQVWIQYDFDKPFKLNEMLVWNYNGQTINSFYGFESVIVEYSADGATWTQVDNVTTFNQASGLDGYAPNTTVAFGDVVVKSVKITANNNFGGGASIFNQYGLSEVRFMYVPLSARKPDPESGATDVSIDTTLSWRPGREAAEHSLYLSTDQQAVIDGTAIPTTVDQAGYTPPTLDIGSTYYWRIDEVNSAETVTTWQGDIWSFSTQQYIVVEDFESYNDIEQEQAGSNLIYLTWIDGYDDPSVNGSTMGYTVPYEPTIEFRIVHGDDQSAPFSYDNSTASYSEITVSSNNLAIGNDWTKSDVQVLTLWFYGDPNNAVTEQLYAKLNGVKVNYDGDAANLAVAGWTQWNIDLSAFGINLANVTELSIGLERIGNSSGSGTLLIDDIRLYKVAP